MRTFVCQGGDSHRFWNVEVSGASLTVTSGRAGTRGRTQTRALPDEASARAEAERLIARKLREGFRETTPPTRPAGDRAALEAALLDSPDDRAAHSAYADLLGEEGDPRGELVSVQLALEDPNLPAAARKKLQQQEQKLLQAHGRAWLGELAAFLLHEPHRTGCRYRLARGWLDALEVGYLTADLADALARSPALRLLRELSVSRLEDPPRRSRRAGALAALARSPFLGGVRVFRLGQDSDEDDWLFPLGSDAQAPAVPDLVRGMPRVEELYLWAHGYDLGALFALPTLGRLRVLKVYHVFGSRYPLEVLAANPALCNLTHLLLQPPRLSSWGPTSIDLPGLQALVRSGHLGSLTHLQLRMASFGDAGVEEIVRSGILRRLRVLDLRCGAVTDAGARRLAECPDTRGMERLNLEANGLTAEGIAALSGLGVKVQAVAFPGDQDAPRSETYYYEVGFE